MDIKINAHKIWIFFWVFPLIFCFNPSVVAQKITVERYQNLHHPILPVLKKYSISLYKVVYSADGKCPTFYVKFRYDPLAGTEIDKVYYETLKANSYYPYAFFIKDDNLRVNVGWEDKEHTHMSIDMDTLDSVSTCKMGK